MSGEPRFSLTPGQQKLQATAYKEGKPQNPALTKLRIKLKINEPGHNGK